jgi:hypothetical protein
MDVGTVPIVVFYFVARPLFAHSGVQLILCCVFVLFFFALGTLCFQFLYTVHLCVLLQTNTDNINKACVLLQTNTDNVNKACVLLQTNTDNVNKACVLLQTNTDNLFHFALGYNPYPLDLSWSDYIENITMDPGK